LLILSTLLVSSSLPLRISTLLAQFLLTLFRVAFFFFFFLLIYLLFFSRFPVTADWRSIRRGTNASSDLTGVQVTSTTKRIQYKKQQIQASVIFCSFFCLCLRNRYMYLRCVRVILLFAFCVLRWTVLFFFSHFILHQKGQVFPNLSFIYLNIRQIYKKNIFL